MNDGRPFTVAGVAVTAAFPVNGVGFLEGSSQWPNPGLIWTTTAAPKAWPPASTRSGTC